MEISEISEFENEYFATTHDDPKMDTFLHYVLHGRSSLPVTDNTIYTLQSFGQHINEEFENTSHFSIPAQAKETPGKLGGKNVVLDASTNVGIFFVEEDRLGVSSQANFSTVRANCCVYKGKWLYEVMLGSKGVMQFGWSTKNCHFSHEHGVGDTPDSYSYDGNRIRKWNVSTAKYGQPWKIGDTIGCAIDLDCGTISFYRNGTSMGEAFNNIKMGYGIAYFPTISLSINETVRVNFGSTPFLYPIEGYVPMQEPPTQDLVKARIIFSALERLLGIFVRLDLQDKPKSNAYIVEKCIFKLLINSLGTPSTQGGVNRESSPYDREIVMKFLDILWSFVDSALMKDIMENLVTSVVIHYRFSPLRKDLKYQKLYLSVLIEMLRHEPTRKFLVQNILFEKIKLPLLMHLKSPDAQLLDTFVPAPYVDVTTLLAPGPHTRTPAFDPSVTRIMDPSVVAQHAQQIAQQRSALTGSAQRPYNVRTSSSSSSSGSSANTSTGTSGSSTVASRSPSPNLALLAGMASSLSSSFEPPTPGSSAQASRQVSSATSAIPLNASTASLRSGLYSDLRTGAAFDISDETVDGGPSTSQEVDKCAEAALDIFTSPSTREKYDNSLQMLNTMVGGLEILQQQVVKMLMNNKDSLRGSSSRYLFLKKFRTFLQQNVSANVSQPFNKCPHPALLCLFHKLTHELRVEWDAYAQRSPHRSVPSNEAFVPCQYFFNDGINYFDLQRIAGIMSYLRKTYDTELSVELESGSSQGSACPSDASLTKSASSAVSIGSPSATSASTSTSTLRQGSSDSFTLNPKARPEASLTSLIELLDGVVLLYHISGHKHTSKMAKVREILREYISTIKSTQMKIDACPSDKPEIKAELERIKQVFTKNALEQARHLAWIKTFVFSKRNQRNVHWLLQTILRTINKAVERGGNLYLFIPEFYFETCLNAFFDLKMNFNPTAPSLTSQQCSSLLSTKASPHLTYALYSFTDFPVTLRQYVRFVTRFFRDTNIISAELRDVIVQSLASLVCYPDSLAVLESGLDAGSRHDLVAKLLTPYENWPWAQTNWILVRFWKGCGYGFGYVQPPHLKNNPKYALGAMNAAAVGPAVDFVKPMPSPIFQAHIGEVLGEDQVKASATVNSILNQLNWAFSEFVGMLQEMQQAYLRTYAQVFIDSRQLKMCATCFDLTVGLLRCLEMITKVAPFMFTDFDRPSAEIFITNIFQLTCQILARVTSRKSAFNMVVSLAMPGLEMVHHYPILSAVAGIWVQLVMKTDANSRQRAITTLIHEPGFQISTLKLLYREQAKAEAGTGGNSEEESEADKLIAKQFYFGNYDEVSRCEMDDLGRLIETLEAELSKENEAGPALNEDNLCPICYARQLEVQFEPCGHRSCRACITHYLMNKRDCFFCKSNVGTIIDIPSDTIED